MHDLLCTKKAESSHSIVIEVKTAFEKPAAEVDTSKLKPSDLALLKTTDPFMYCSILGQKAVLQQDMDASDIHSSVCDHMNKKSKKVVTRKTRISCESYPDFMAGINNDTEFKSTAN